MATTHLTGVHTVAVPVTDQDRALAYYTGTLGFEVRMDGELQEGFRWIEVAPPGSATSVALVAAGDGVPAGVDTGIRLATSDAAADHAALTDAGASTGELLRWEGVPPMFSLRDVDGNTLYVMEIPG
ncbi:catechol 2,3-dioxygenase-like lactoylglutathione lyase family enzyme [Cellulosimicrobium cellulans]|uniref:VOC family protein n=1 Tax=Cellulosimicrobium cellulans TaxID=1710 RepID=UPI00195BDEF4|nr:VOC family protein [Cellulosimicrobium cellulans]MBM7819036.1 catechol 2,3-dioxygenase-like lactoylglutathione lyase family enzyme [Cellulosimicrobium cellulans]